MHLLFPPQESRLFILDETFKMSLWVKNHHLGILMKHSPFKINNSDFNMYFFNFSAD